jgi:hypothetical protein
MTRPGYVIHLKGHEINGSHFSGEGSQIAALVAATTLAVGDCTWFVSDVEQMDGPRYLPDNVTTPVQIGNADKAIEWLSQVTQFVWGMFLAVPTDRLPVEWGEIWSEGEPFQEIGESILAINSFDSSCFYTYAMTPTALQPLVSRFGGVIQTPTDWEHRAEAPGT